MKKIILISSMLATTMLAKHALATPPRCDEYDYDHCYYIFTDDNGNTHKAHFGYDVGSGDEGDLEHYDTFQGETVYNSDGKVVKEYKPKDGYEYESYSPENMYQTAAYEYTGDKLTQKTTYYSNGNTSTQENYNTNGDLTQKTAYTQSGQASTITNIYDGDILRESIYTTNGLDAQFNVDSSTGNGLLGNGGITTFFKNIDAFNADGIAFGHVWYDNDGNIIKEQATSRTDFDMDNDAWPEISDEDREAGVTLESMGIFSEVYVDDFNAYLENLNKKTIEVKNADGSTTIYDKAGNVLGFKNKRIYTVEEATKLSKPRGNTFKIRYK